MFGTHCKFYIFKCFWTSNEKIDFSSVLSYLFVIFYLCTVLLHVLGQPLVFLSDLAVLLF